MNEIFEMIVALLGNEGAVNFCESMFWNTLHNTNETIIEACSTVWQDTYNLNK